MSTSKLKLGVVALSTCLLLALPAIAEIAVSGNTVTFEVADSSVGYDLTVTGPGDFRHQESFEAGSLMSWTAAGVDDGQYKYELVPVAARRERGVDAPDSTPVAESISGAVRLQGGTLANPDRPERLTKDVVHLDDVIVDGSLCVGIDCVNNENFGFDTIRLKENNLRIKFEDTSAGTFPSNDWQLTANDSANGGANFFSIDDVTNARVPFKVTAAAPTNSFFMASDGDVGFGTASPAVNGVHIADGNTPALRLEQNGSSGFTAQTWDLAGNETNFFIRDVTNGSLLPFRIRPGAPSSSIDVAANGDVGMGDASPDFTLDVERTTGSANIAVSGADSGGLFLQDTGATDDQEIVQFLVNDSSFRMRGLTNAFANGVDGIYLDLGTGDVAVNCTGPAEDFVVGDGGTCASGARSWITAGSTSLSGTSSRTLKENLETIEVGSVLEKISGIDVYHYDFINGPADRIGLMAEDFHQIFGRGSDKVIEGQEIQMALWLAVQELTAQNKQLAEKLSALEGGLKNAE